MTYRELRDKLNVELSEDQLNCDIMVEIANECFPAEWKICGPNHDCLDNYHPVLEVV